MAVKGKRGWTYRGPADPSGYRAKVAREMTEMRERLARLTQAEMVAALTRTLGREIYPANVSNWERGTKLAGADIYVAYREISGAPRPFDPAIDERSVLAPRLLNLESRVRDMERAVGRPAANGETIDPGDLITAPAAAELVNVSRQTIHNWVRTGDVRTAKIGKRLLVSRSDVLARAEKS